jgi:PAS domain S-box-containing protein
MVGQDGNREDSGGQASHAGFFEELFAILPVGFFSTDPQTSMIIDANPAFQKMLGLSLDELQQRTWMDLTPDRYLKRNLEEDQRALTKKEAVFTRKHYKRGDGSEVPVMLSTRVLFHPDLKKEVFCNFVVDLTKALEQEEALLRLSFPVLPIFKGVALVPLIGRLNPERVKDLERALIERLERNRPRTLILDFSGCVIEDPKVASAITRVFSMVRFVGIVPLIAGIPPDLAMALAGEGGLLDGVPVFGTVEQALSVAVASLP